MSCLVTISISPKSQAKKGQCGNQILRGLPHTIHHDTDFRGISRGEAQGTCIERPKHKNIKTCSDCSNPIDVGFNMVTKVWACFIKIHLQIPHNDGFALLNREYAFVMEMENSEKVIRKVEKGFELITKPHNLHLVIECDTL